MLLPFVHLHELRMSAPDGMLDLRAEVRGWKNALYARYAEACTCCCCCWGV